MKLVMDFFRKSLIANIFLYYFLQNENNEKEIIKNI